MENLETCVFFCFSYSPCCYQASGRDRVYGSTSATKKSILLPKNSHTHSYSVSHVRGSITRHINIQQFSEKTESIRPTSSVKDSISPRKPRGGGGHSGFVFSFHFSIFVLNFLIFTSPFWKNGKVKNKRHHYVAPLGFRSLHHLFS